MSDGGDLLWGDEWSADSSECVVLHTISDSKYEDRGAGGGN